VAVALGGGGTGAGVEMVPVPVHAANGMDDIVPSDDDGAMIVVIITIRRRFSGDVIAKAQVITDSPCGGSEWPVGFFKFPSRCRVNATPFRCRKERRLIRRPKVPARPNQRFTHSGNTRSGIFHLTVCQVNSSSTIE
jgi:hypothetical protein